MKHLFDNVLSVLDPFMAKSPKQIGEQVFFKNLLSSTNLIFSILSLYLKVLPNGMGGGSEFYQSKGL